jgi:hypothetical protein
MASGWMIRSAASRRASSAAANAVISSGYPMAIRSATASLSFCLVIACPRADNPGAPAAAATPENLAQLAIIVRTPADTGTTRRG